jgi:hypothetical protein
MSTRYQFAPDERSLEKALQAIGWGLFFIWIGLALLSDFGWGVGLLGVGIITLGEQMARRYFNLKVERFWITIGALFLLGGAWELFEVRVGLTPILLIIVGIVLLLSPLLARQRA